MKKMLILIAVLCAAVASAEMAEVGKPFPVYTLQDQFGNTNTLSKATRFVIVASEKDVSGMVNDWMKSKEQGFLVAHHAEYVSDIEPMPGVITTLFALPKMKKYPFTLLLATDKEFARTYPSQKHKIALFVLDDQQVLTDVKYLDTPAEVEAILTAGK